MLDKANKMVEEVSREEKTGYRAEIPNVKKEEKKNEIIDTYGDDFEEIDEDLPEDNHLLDSNDNYNHQNQAITESAGGITVSQSLGVDPSVDSLALDDYDHIEPVERIN